MDRWVKREGAMIKCSWKYYLTNYFLNTVHVCTTMVLIDCFSFEGLEKI